MELLRVKSLCLSHEHRWPAVLDVLDDALQVARPMPYLYAVAEAEALFRRLGAVDLTHDFSSAADALREDFSAEGGI